MSDIGLGPGYAFLAGALLTLAVGGVSLLLALVVGVLLPYSARETLPVRLFRFARGPLACLVVGGACVAVTGAATPGFDDWWFACPVVGVGLETVITFLSAQTYRARAADATLRQ